MAVTGTVKLIKVDVMGKLAEEMDADADPVLPQRMSAILTLEKLSQGCHKAIVVWHTHQQNTMFLAHHLMTLFSLETT